MKDKLKPRGTSPSFPLISHLSTTKVGSSVQINTFAGVFLTSILKLQQSSGALLLETLSASAYLLLNVSECLFDLIKNLPTNMCGYSL